MDDQTENQINEPSAEPVQAEQKKGWGRWLAIGGIALLAVGGIGVAGAVSSDFGRHGMGGFMHHAAMGFGEHRMGRVLDEIDATSDQEKKIWAIVDATRTEIRPLMLGFGDAREEVAKILGAPTVDRAAIEALRAERVAAIDQASRTMTAAILDAAEVLTPEQRAKLLEHFNERGSHRR